MRLSRPRAGRPSIRASTGQVLSREGGVAPVKDLYPAVTSLVDALLPVGARERLDVIGIVVALEIGAAGEGAYDIAFVEPA